MSFNPRSMLLVSGEKTERFAKALAAGADLSAELDASFDQQGLLHARGRRVDVPFAEEGTAHR